MRRFKPLSPEERAKREAKDREEAIAEMRDMDVARGRLEGFMGGRVKPLISEDE